MSHLLRTDLGGTARTGPGQCVLSLLLFSDVHVMDTVSPARGEWVELLGNEPRWKPLLHMHRPYEAITHWAFAAHVEAARRKPLGPWSARPFDFALSLGDNIDNAQHNELEVFLTILSGGQTRVSAHGGVHEASAALGSGPWPYWCPEPSTDDLWKPRGYPAVAGYVARASAELSSDGLGFSWAALPGNHDLMRQGTALPDADIERIATGSHKTLQCPAGFDPADPLTLFVTEPAAFSCGTDRVIEALASRRAVDQQGWIEAVVARGALGYTAQHVASGCADAVIDTGRVRIILLDTNHPAGDYQGSIGEAQLDWLEQRLAEVDAQSGRLAVLASHHGSASLTNTRGPDASRRHAAALTAVAHRHPCVVAWLVGHRHLHQIVPHPGPGGGFWEITTGSLIDWPSQARAVEFVCHDDGSLEIVCTLLDHEAPPDSLAFLHRDLSRLFAGPQAERMQGQAGDGNVRLRR